MTVALARSPRRPSLTRLAAWFFALLALAAFAGMLALLVVESLPAWRHAGAGYVTSPEWAARDGRFGALAMIYGTTVVAAVALLLAAPVGIGAAVCTAELMPRRLRIATKAIVELLAGIPSVVYGLLGVLYLRGFAFEVLERAGAAPLSGDTLLTAGVLLAVMVLPTVVTLADDALRAVPRSRRETGRALGLTRAESVLFVALPGARRGLVAAVMLGLGRALGETIAVFLVVGRQDGQLPESLLSLEPLARAGQTLSTKLAGPEVHLAQGDPVHWGAVVGLGLFLVAAVLAVSFVGALWRGGPGRA